MKQQLGIAQRQAPQLCGETYASHLEELHVAGLDFLGRLLDALCVVAHELDLRQLAPAGLGLHERVHRVLRGEVDEQLLRLLPCSQLWNSLAAFGLGAPLKMAEGPVTMGVPSAG